MYKIKVEATFKADYKRVIRAYPYIRKELESSVMELIENGKVPEEYCPHVLSNTNGNYNGHIDFHISNGEVDVIVLYMPHHTNPVIRLVRMGTHEDLFRGPLL